MRTAQQTNVESLQAKEAEDVAKAMLIEANAEAIDALLGLLRTGIQSSMDWGELEELIVRTDKSSRAQPSLFLSSSSPLLSTSTSPLLASPNRSSRPAGAATYLLTYLLACLPTLPYSCLLTYPLT